MAAVVIGHPVRKPGPDIADTEPLHEKLAKLVGPGGQIEGPGLMGRALEQLRIKNPHHRHAGPAWADDSLGTVEDVDRAGGDGTGLVPVAGVEARLTAAGLGAAKLAAVPEPLEHLRDGEAHLRRHLIDEAGNEQADLHGSSLVRPGIPATRNVGRASATRSERLSPDAGSPGPWPFPCRPGFRRSRCRHPAGRRAWPRPFPCRRR